MRKRMLGRTMVPVSEVSLDAQSLSLQPEGRAIVEAAIAQGVSFVSVPDGPQQAGDLRLVGGAVPRDERAVPVPLGDEPRGAASGWIGASAQVGRFASGDPLSEILTALGRPTLDVMSLARPTLMEALQGPAVDALSHARRLGRVRLMTVRCASVDDALSLVRSGRWDVLEIDYNLFEHGRAFLELFHEAAHAGVGLIVYNAIVPPAATPVREARREVLARIGAALPSLGGRLEEACVAYALRAPGVSTVAVAPWTAALMGRLAGVASQPPIGAETADAIEDVVLGLDRR